MATYIPAPPSEPPSQSAEPEPPRKGRITCWGCTSAVAIAIGLLFIATFAFAFLSQTGKSITASTGSFLEGGVAVGDALAVSEKFYKNLIKHDYESAYNDLAPTLAAKYSENSLEENWIAFEKQAGGVEVNHAAGYIKTGDNNNFNGTVILAQPGGTHQYVIKTLILSKVNNSWKIVDAKPSLIPEP